MLQLFRRRSLIVPTLPGALLLLAVLIAALMLLRQPLHDWLAPVQPTPRASVQVIEGWMDWAELKRARHLLGPKPPGLIVTSGGPRSGDPAEPTNAEHAVTILRAQGLTGVLALSAPDTRIDRTYVSALAVRDGLAARGLMPAAINVYSPGAHARRSRLVYEMAFGPGVEVGIIAVEPHRYDPRHWWAGSEGAKFVMGELQSWLWTKCCFWP
jgi:hypothetical protein